MLYKTLDEAMAAKLDLTDRIQSIDVQLAERRAKVAVGRVPDAEYKEYLEWKGRAMRSKTALISKLSRVKRAIQELRYERVQSRINGRDGAGALLSDLYSLSKSLVAAGADISQEEQALLDDVQLYLDQN